MHKLSRYLRFYVQERVNRDKAWQNIKVLLHDRRNSYPVRVDIRSVRVVADVDVGDFVDVSWRYWWSGRLCWRWYWCIRGVEDFSYGGVRADARVGLGLCTLMLQRSGMCFCSASVPILVSPSVLLLTASRIFRQCMLWVSVSNTTCVVARYSK